MAVVQVWTINSGRALLIAAARNDVSVLAWSMYVRRKTKVGPKLSFPSFFCNYRKSSKETRGSYSFSEGPNAAPISAFLPIVFKVFCGSY